MNRTSSAVERLLLETAQTGLNDLDGASRTGWGAVCQGKSNGGQWSLQETQYHINYIELLAVLLALQMFVRDQREITVLV